MRILTTVTHSEGYFDLLQKTAAAWGYELSVLGRGIPWKGLAWKILMAALLIITGILLILYFSS